MHETNLENSPENSPGKPHPENLSAVLSNSANEPPLNAAAPNIEPAPALVHKPRAKYPSVIWLVPIIAAAIGLWLVAQSILSQGPMIYISFNSAEGLEIGKTKIRYKDVDIGQVKSIALSHDRKKVIVKAQLIKSASDVLATDTRFFVVRPRISGGSVSGLSTLLSGAYISVDVGIATETTDEFAGLENPPLITRDSVGHEFVLLGAEIGSVNYGAPVFFRHINAGHVTHYSLNKDGRGVTVRVFIDAPYDQYVTADTRFWHASGIGLSLDANGVKLATESLTSMIEGGLAFQDHDDALPGGTPAVSGAVFSLYGDRERAMRAPDTRVRRMRMYFPESLRGLSKGAPVDLRGIVIGEVKSLGLDFTENGRVPRFPVEVSIYPDRLRSKVRKGGAAPDDDTAEKEKQLLTRLMELGLRAQLRSGNLLTGQQYIALDFFPDAVPAKMDWSGDVPVMPTVGGGLGELQDTVVRIAKKIDKLPLDQMASELVKAIQQLNKTLDNAEQLVKRLDTETAPEITATLKVARSTLNNANTLLTEDAPLQQELRDSLKQVAKSARALASLADMLERHPEVLVYGKEKVKP